MFVDLMGWILIWIFKKVYYLKKKYVKINLKCFILFYGVFYGKILDRGMNNGYLIKIYW